jgi:NAD-dependent deacetylase
MESLEIAAGLLARAERPVVFTGAGISAESGIPTFRDALTGLWARFDAQALATPEAFRRDPALVWGWYEWRRAAAERVEPNAGHVAAAEIARGGVLITQNVDDLHERAGADDVVHLHGSLFAPRCSACAKPAPAQPAPAQPAPAQPAPAQPAPAPPASAQPLDAEPSSASNEGPIEPPPCAHCGAPLRPGVVWFGEQLPLAALEAAVAAARDCDLLITVGTSGLVYPAAEIPQVAARMGADVIQVNPEPTPLDPIATVNLRGPAATVLPALVRMGRGIKLKDC